jgi:hypothetical protein
VHGEPNQQLLLHSFPFPNKTNRFRTVSLCLLSARRVNDGRPSCPSHSHRPPLAPPPMSRSRPLDAGGLRPNLRRAARTFGRAVGHPMSVRARAARRPAPTQSALRFFSTAGPRKRLRGAPMPEKTGRLDSETRTTQAAFRDRKRRPRRARLAPDYSTVLCPDQTPVRSYGRSCYCSMPPPVSCDSQPPAPMAGRTRTAGSDLAACGIKEKNVWIWVQISKPSVWNDEQIIIGRNISEFMQVGW